MLFGVREPRVASPPINPPSRPQQRVHLIAKILIKLMGVLRRERRAIAAVHRRLAVPRIEIPHQGGVVFAEGPAQFLLTVSWTDRPSPRRSTDYVPWGD